MTVPRTTVDAKGHASSRHRYPKLALAVLTVLISPCVADSPVAAQGSVTVPNSVLSGPACSRCRIEINRVGRLEGKGPIADANGFEDLSAVDDDRILAIPSYRTEWWLIDVNGSVLERHGHEGEGPGEFKGASQIARATADSVSIYDRALGRVEVFSLAGEYARTLRTPPGASSYIHWGGERGIAVGRYADRDGAGPRAGLPYHLVIGDSIVKSFGPLIRKIDPRNPFFFDRIVLRWGQFIIGLERANNYAVELYDFEGRPIGQLTRSAGWFPRTDKFIVGEPEIPPSPLIQDAWVEPNGLLFVLISRPGRQWKMAFSKTPVPTEGGQLFYRVERPDLYYEGVVEVFDLTSRTLLVSQVVPFVPSYALGHGLVAAKRSPDDDPSGVALDLYRLRVVGRP